MLVVLVALVVGLGQLEQLAWIEQLVVRLVFFALVAVPFDRRLAELLATQYYIGLMCSSLVVVVLEVDLEWCLLW